MSAGNDDVDTDRFALSTPLSTRRRLLTQAVGTGIAVAGAFAAGCGSGSRTVTAQTGSNSGTGTSGGSTQRDIDILNFALNLEYLDSEYYTYATSGRGIETFGVGVTGSGTAGATTGGAAVTFDNSTIQTVATQIAADERAHVNLLRQMIQQLGGTPIAKPAIDLATTPRALGIDPTTTNGFLQTTRAFEDTGASAYAGTARYLFNPSVVQGAARIISAETYHSGNIRLWIAQRSVTSPALDALDVPPPPTGSSFFAVDSNGLTIARTVTQVLAIVLQTAAPTAASRGGFFPSGPNGNLPALLSLT